MSDVLSVYQWHSCLCFFYSGKFPILLRKISFELNLPRTITDTKCNIEKTKKKQQKQKNTQLWIYHHVVSLRNKIILYTGVIVCAVSYGRHHRQQQNYLKEGLLW